MTISKIPNTCSMCELSNITHDNINNEVIFFKQVFKQLKIISKVYDRAINCGCKVLLYNTTNSSLSDKIIFIEKLGFKKLYTYTGNDANGTDVVHTYIFNLTDYFSNDTFIKILNTHIDLLENLDPSVFKPGYKYKNDEPVESITELKEVVNREN